MTASDVEILSLAGRLATFETAHRLPKRRSSATRKKAPAAVVWPHEAPAAEELANAGFYYSPSPTSHDNVICFHCKANVDGWEPSDSPVDEHLALSPYCAWAITQGIRKRMDDPDRSEENPMSEQLLEARIATFGDRWPHEQKKGWKAKIKKLAEAGWFYDPSPDEEDGVGCCYCGLSLDGWEPKDNPVDEHKRRSPDCLFFVLKDQYAQLNKSTKAKSTRGKKTRASSRSRVSTQSTATAATSAIFSEPPSLASIGEPEAPPPKKRATRGRKNAATKEPSSDFDIVPQEAAVEDTAMQIESELPDSQPEVDPEINPEPEVEPEIEPEPELEPNNEMEIDPEPEPDVEPELPSKRGLELESEAEPIQILKDSSVEVEDPRAESVPSSDIENQPPETTPKLQAKISRGTKRTSDGVAKPSWTPVDLENVFLASPIISRFEADENNMSNMIAAIEAGLSKEESQMTVEQWVNHNALLHEKRLQDETEKMISRFESEGARAIKVLQALPSV